MYYQTKEEASGTRVAEDDFVTLICRVGYSSKIESGVWAPILTWYDSNDQQLAKSDGSTPANPVRLDVLVKATLTMHPKNFRCHTAYGNAQGTIGTSTANHNYSSIPPTYTEDQTITFSVDCKLSFICLNEILFYILFIEIEHFIY